ncbi:MAG: GNAT family N-acetyltransferase [Rickettsiales bacterium]|nr:GNAT family N-acetyltransferase [Rickettsiales bacterium]
MKDIISHLILTAGPSISQKEIEYGVDAIKNGWNHHHSDYIKKFENKFGEYVGAKHAIATSSCTGAMHLAMIALGFGEGDEIIIPEITWIATAAAVKYVGATPVFCDVDRDSWTMCPKSLEKSITPRTKAIMPVHIYGHPCDMQPIWELAKKHDLLVIEDAAQSIGAEYYGKKTGSLGDVAAFSFQGAKAIVTGEGGIYVSNNDQITEKFRFYWDQGRDPKKTLYNIDIGYKYKMSNAQAAIGLAQIERVEEIVARKIQIFKWYQERLGDLSDLVALNAEKPWAKNIYWMSSIILEEKVKHSRDEFISKLKERMIDSRPIFYPLSSLPMFSEVDNKNSYHVGLRGINLPSGHNRTEEEIDYICSHVRDILGVKSKEKKISGFLKYRENVEIAIKANKTDSAAQIEIRDGDKLVGKLIPITTETLKDDEKISLLTNWRKDNQNAFPSQFSVTFEGTKTWTEKQLLQQKDRILYFVSDEKNQLIGHVGLFRFDYHKKACELDNIVRGVNGVAKGLMLLACQEIIKFAKNELQVSEIYLRVFSDNQPALKLYDKIGFEEILRIPLRKEEEEGNIFWKEVISDPYFAAEKYFVTMKLK